MSNLQFFKNEQFGIIRTMLIDDEPWFVAKDVCDAFGETNRNRAMQMLEDDEKGYTQMTTPGGIQQVAIVNEPGLYSLLFAMRPEKARGVADEYIVERQEKLRAFKRWVTHEVLPAIRRTGVYAAPGTVTNAMAELHAAMTAMEDMLRDMKQAIPRRSALDRALTAQAEGRLEARHVAGRNGLAHQLLDREKIGHKITVYMIDEDLTVDEFAELAGVDRRSVYRWKNGTHAPADNALTRVCEILGCDVADLLH